VTLDTVDIDFDRRFRDVMGNFCTGLTVIASTQDGAPIGFTCQSFFSVSIEPPLVAFSVAKTSSTFPLIRTVTTCCVNVLSADQEPVSRSFSRSGSDKWAGVGWHRAPRTGNPVVDGVLVWIECEIEAEFDSGDHVIVLCKVLDLGHESQAGPLLFFRSQYRLLSGEGSEQETGALS
jgi:flavin reductase (DIM6/NTAB) family NADH-FMN oxidoreductase RutF